MSSQITLPQINSQRHYNVKNSIQLYRTDAFSYLILHRNKWKVYLKVDIICFDWAVTNQQTKETYHINCINHQWFSCFANYLRTKLNEKDLDLHVFLFVLLEI